MKGKTHPNQGMLNGRKRVLALLATLAMALGLIAAPSAFAAEAVPIGNQDSLLAGHSDISSTAANGWQIVSGGYTGYGASDKTVITSTDGLVRTHKSVVPTDVENEFLVYLSVDTKSVSTITYEYLSEFVGDLSLYYNFTAGSGAAYDEGNLGGPGVGTGKQCQSGSTEVHITWTYNGQPIADKSVFIQVPNSAFYLDVGGGHYICIASITNNPSHSTDNQYWDSANNRYEVEVHLTEDAYNALYTAVGTGTAETAAIGSGTGTGAATVVDNMGPHMVINDTDPVYSGLIDGTVSGSSTGFTWTLSPKSNALGETETVQYYDDLDNPDRVTRTVTTTWRYNIAEMVYKVRLDVTDSGFASDAAYAVNQSATLNYTYTDGTTSDPRSVDFTVPQVRGTLYDFEATKVDGSTPPQTLSGATFTLTGPSEMDAADQISETITTGDDGVLSFSDLPWGTYTLTETAPPSGYSLPDPASWTLQIGYTSWPSAIVTHSVTDNENDVYSYTGADAWQIVNQPNSITVTKSIATFGDLTLGEINQTIYMALWDRTNNTYLKDSTGQIIYQTVTITNGVPSPATFTFEDVPSGSYSVWELSAAPGTSDASAVGISAPMDLPGTADPVVQLTGIATSGYAEPNSAHPDVSVTVTNTYGHKNGQRDVTVRKAWASSDGTPITVPAGATVEFTLYRIAKDDPEGTLETVGAITLNGGETTAWQAVWTGLDTQDTNGYAYTYMVKETACSDSRFEAYLGQYATTPMGADDYQTNVAGGTIWNKKTTTDIVVRKIVPTDPAADKNDEFPFTATLASGSFGANQDSRVSVDESTARFSLKDGEEVTLYDVPVGVKLTVTESVGEKSKVYTDWTISDLYATTVQLNNGTQQSASSLELTTVDGQTVTFRNAHKQGFLRVMKVVAGDVPYHVGVNDFSFAVTGPSYPNGKTVIVTKVGTAEGVTSGYTNLGLVYVGDYTVAEDLATAAFPGYTQSESVANDVTTTVKVDASTTAGAPATATITNTYSQDKRNLTFTKVWVDDDDEFDLRYSMDEFLGYLVLRDGVHSGSATYDDTSQVSIEQGADANTWTITFKGMPDYVDGNKATYTLTELDAIQYYTPKDSPAVVGGTITNTLITTTVTAKKAWKNADGSATAPDGATVTFTLYDDEEATDYSVTLDGKADTALTTLTGGYESDAWTATFIVPNDGSTYTVVETTPYPGYDAGDLANGTITNTQEATTASATKKWVNADGSETAPDDATVTFTLYAGDGPVKVDGEIVAVTLDGKADTTVPSVTGGYESDTWTATFVNLPTYQPGTTTEVEYTIKETGTYPGYSASGLANGTITNTQAATSLTVEKKWVDADGSDTWPDNVTAEVQLTADGEPVEGKTATLSADEPSYTFEGLPEFQADGKTKIAYSVTEDAVAGYTCEVGAIDDGKVTVTNTYNAKGTAVLEVTKILAGSKLNPGQFSFALKDDTGKTIQTKTNDADGRVVFDAIPYDNTIFIDKETVEQSPIDAIKDAVIPTADAAPLTAAEIDTGAKLAKTFTYTVEEVIPDEAKSNGNTKDNITYDDHVVTVKVEVTDNGDGTLTATPSYEGSTTFTNVYNEPNKSNPSIATSKTAVSKPNNGSFFQEGETVEYEITITNNGNVELSEIFVADDLTGDEWTLDKLAVGESKTYKVAYKVTKADVEEGTVENQATVTAKDSDGNKITSTDEASVKTGTSGKSTPAKKGHILPRAGDTLPIVGLLAAVVVAAGALVLARRRMASGKDGQHNDKQR